MSQSLSRILIHLVFSTKDRLRLIPPEIRNELNGYIAGILKNLCSPALAVGSAADHAHVLFILSKNVTLCEIVEEVKKSSSKWIKTKGSRFLKFQWQAGYGAFSVSQSQKRLLMDYIDKQAQHHQGVSFEDEFRRLLQRHHTNYDERYFLG